MAKKNFTLTLTRWHHVATRLKALANTLLTEARDTMSVTNIDNLLIDEQIRALEARGQRAKENMRKGMEAMKAVGTIRTQLGKANGNYGVTGMMAEAEDLRAQARALDMFSHLDLETATPIGQVNEVLRQRMSEKQGLALVRGMRVALIPASELENIRDQKMALEAMAATISDQVADINRQTLSIEIDEEIAKAVGI